MDLIVYILLAAGVMLLAAISVVFFTNFKGKKITEIQLFATIDSTNSAFAEYIARELICNSKALYNRGIQAQIYIICDRQDIQTAKMISILKEKEENLHMVQIG